MLVVDANVAVAACVRSDGFAELPADLVAPPLMWSEVRSTLHLQAAKGSMSSELAAELHQRLEAAPIRRLDPPELGPEAWGVADDLGWGRTYDAEYVALAMLMDCRLVTLDIRLCRGAAHLGFVCTPDEL